MANQRRLEVVIAGDSRQLERAFGRAGKASETFGKKMQRGAGAGLIAVGKAGTMGAAAGLAVAAVGLVKASKAAVEAEASNARLAAQLKALGKDTATVRGRIDDTVQSLSRLGAFDDEDLQDAFTTLVRSSGNVTKSQKDLALVADIARGAQLDLATAAKLVNRVNAGNVGSLKRYGIALEKGATKEQAIAALRKKFAGQAEAYSKTAAGAQEALAVASENALEAIGVALTPLIVEFSKFAQKVLPDVATAVSKYLGVAIEWVKANWPQIRGVLSAVWDGLKFAYENILKPTVTGIVIAIGAMVGFVKRNMPQIRAAAQAAFAWIKTNIVPTVVAVANGVRGAIALMVGFWRKHGSDVLAIVRPVFNAIKTTVLGAISIVKSIIEGVLAVIRGDWGSVFGSLKTIAKTGFDAVLTWLGTVPSLIFLLATDIGGKIVDGIISGLGSLYGTVKKFLEKQIKNIIDKLSPFSPVEHGGEIIANRLTNGLVAGIAKNRGRMAKSLSSAVKAAIFQARDNLGGLTSGLGGMLGTIIGESSPQAKRLRQIRAQQTRQERERERVRLNAAIAEAQTDEERAQARQDLADWELDQEAQRLEESIAAQQAANERSLADLTAKFNTGVISAEKFRAELDKLIGGRTGADLGFAFATEFGLQLAAVRRQISALVKTPTGLAGPEVSSPRAVSREELREWKKRRAERRRELEKRYSTKDSAGGSKITDAERNLIDEAMRKWDRQNKKPRALAMGGVLRRAVLAGEAGPEAVLPLSSGRAQRMLAEAMDGAQRINGYGGTTIVNVTVSGNEFSAQDFARKLAPELRRQVSLTRSV